MNKRRTAKRAESRECPILCVRSSVERRSLQRRAAAVTVHFSTLFSSFSLSSAFHSITVEAVPRGATGCKMQELPRMGGERPGACRLSFRRTLQCQRHNRSTVAAMWLLMTHRGRHVRLLMTHRGRHVRLLVTHRGRHVWLLMTHRGRHVWLLVTWPSRRSRARTAHGANPPLASRQRAAGSGQRTAGCGLWAVGSGQRAVGCGLWTVGCGLWAVG